MSALGFGFSLSSSSISAGVIGRGKEDVVTGSGVDFGAEAGAGGVTMPGRIDGASVATLAAGRTGGVTGVDDASRTRSSIFIPSFLSVSR